MTAARRSPMRRQLARRPPSRPTRTHRRPSLRSASLRGDAASTPDDLDGACAAVAPRRHAVYVSAVPTRPLAEQIDVAGARSRAAGLRAGAASRGAQLRQRATRSTLISPGSPARPACGACSSSAATARRRPAHSTRAIEVIESGLLQRHGIVEIGIAGYPDGHPRHRRPTTLDRALAAKLEAAAQTGLDGAHRDAVRLLDAAPIIAWIARLRDLGIDQPVRIGLAGPTTLADAACATRASAA